MAEPAIADAQQMAAAQAAAAGPAASLPQAQRATGEGAAEDFRPGGSRQQPIREGLEVASRLNQPMPASHADGRRRSRRAKANPPAKAKPAGEGQPAGQGQPMGQGKVNRGQGQPMGEGQPDRASQGKAKGDADASWARASCPLRRR